MKTSTLAQGPAVGGRYITVGSTIYTLEPGDDPGTYPAELKAVLDAEALDIAAHREMQRREDAARAAWKTRAAPTVSVM